MIFLNNRVYSGLMHKNQDKILIQQSGLKDLFRCGFCSFKMPSVNMNFIGNIHFLATQVKFFNRFHHYMMTSYAAGTVHQLQKENVFWFSLCIL
jgi:hypothetical protein